MLIQSGCGDLLGLLYWPQIQIRVTGAAFSSKLFFNLLYYICIFPKTPLYAFYLREFFNCVSTSTRIQN
jgi:hypothetical protein